MPAKIGFCSPQRPLPKGETGCRNSTQSLACGHASRNPTRYIYCSPRNTRSTGDTTRRKGPRYPRCGLVWHVISNTLWPPSTNLQIQQTTRNGPIKQYCGGPVLSLPGLLQETQNNLGEPFVSKQVPDGRSAWSNLWAFDDSTRPPPTSFILLSHQSCISLAKCLHFLEEQPSDSTHFHESFKGRSCKGMPVG